MGWKKVVQSKDLIVYEREFKEHKLKIEARKNEEQNWEVFQIKLQGDNSSILSEYLFESKKEALKRINELQSGKIIVRQTIKTPISVSLKRLYKEDFVEKWFFDVNNEKIRNIVFAKFDSKIHVDVIIHERYKNYENSIISQIEDKLGFRELADMVQYDIYYFNKNKYLKNEINNKDEVNQVDVEFDFYSEEE